MTDWKNFEIDCYKKLQEDYGKLAKIILHGESDSTIPDIEMILPNGENFFVEVKSPAAQCCQFVLFPEEETKTFHFSERNKMNKTQACRTIIAYMEKNFSRYCKPTQKGLSVDVEPDTLYDLVREYYGPKLVRFFMTKDCNDNYIIFPAANFRNYFTITSCYRKKKCGSSEPSKNNIPEIEQALTDHAIRGCVEMAAAGKTRYFLATDDDGLHNKRLICNNYTYQLKTNSHSKAFVPSHTAAHIYEIRRLSNTSNPNVICQLALKDVSQNANDLNAFESIFE